MSHYRKVDVRIWNDEKFRELSDDGQFVFIFLLTHPQMTSLGAMRSSPAALADDLQWAPERFAKGFGEVSAKGMVEFDRKGPIVALPNFLKYNAPENPNVLKSWVKSADLLPSCGLKLMTLQRLKSLAEGLSKAFQEGFEKAFANPLAKALAKQEQEQEHKPTASPSQGISELDQSSREGSVVRLAAEAGR